jgi:2-keto-4-pentenoate hydratase/2-oxohepta-3-ene-1,7-dioic acid hydratase in catechol pathway
VQIVRFQVDGRTRYGVLDGPVVIECTGTPFGPFRRGRRRYPLRQVVVLPPVLPSKIVTLGLAPGGPPADGPLLLLKPISALVGPEDPIVAPPRSARLTCDGALAAVIKRRCRNVPAARAREYVLGWAALNDVTARDLVAGAADWTRAKAFDTFCPLGPCIATDLDPNTASVQTWVNGALRDTTCVKERGVTVEEMLARVSEVMTLLPGDVVAADLPGASGPVEPGDRVEIRIEGVGSLRNPVVRL